MLIRMYNTMSHIMLQCITAMYMYTYVIVNTNLDLLAELLALGMK